MAFQIWYQYQAIFILPECQLIWQTLNFQANQQTTYTVHFNWAKLRNETGLTLHKWKSLWHQLSVQAELHLCYDSRIPKCCITPLQSLQLSNSCYFPEKHILITIIGKMQEHTMRRKKIILWMSWHSRKMSKMVFKLWSNVHAYSTNVLIKHHTIMKMMAGKICYIISSRRRDINPNIRRQKYKNYFYSRLIFCSFPNGRGEREEKFMQRLKKICGKLD